MKGSNVEKMFCCLVMSKLLIFLEDLVMKKTSLVFITLLAISSMAFADDPCAVTHWEFQAVREDGTSSFDDDGPEVVVLEGIILNNPEETLDPTANFQEEPVDMGGKWQIYIQGEGDDHAGTAIWIGQNYGVLPFRPLDENYENDEWISELCRINHDPCTGYIFNTGDRVRVTGKYLFYKGKLNINENHYIDPDYDFTVELLEPAVGLPQPEVIMLDDVKDGDDNYIFDANRLTGCEYYQARLVRINDVNIVNPENWGPDYTDETETVTIKDVNGLTFPVKLGIGAGFSRFDCPAGQIDVIGIFDQEPPAPPYPPDPKSGYRIWVSNYDGNGLVLTDRGYKRGNLPGDINSDFKVDFKDFAELADNWLVSRDGLYDCNLPE